MAGPIAHGVAQALRKQQEGAAASSPPPSRRRIWFYVLGSVVLLGWLVIAWQVC